ncbi:cytochrome P450 [Westerdykella ornata]|uniref:Cytochrome P450 n=1 Tax=Westerdykella ornata TaxID=318751 RepID=A0A6A6JF24_WESOR|nr:cytochrome P450 [Westerdykella ornata]KAF2274907.1 cytochrome P450 [Westerdykella ornata]
MLGFKYTLNGIEHNTVDHKLIRTRLYARVLQVNGPSNLAALFPFLKEKLDIALRSELLNGQASSNGFTLPVAQTARRLASKLMALVFYGELLATDETFSNALLRYPRDMIKCMAAFQLTPSFLSPTVHSVLTKRGEAMRTILGRLRTIMKAGREEWDEPESTKEVAFPTQAETLAMTDDSDYWNPDLLSQSLLGIWFAASHQPWMFLDFVLLELCARKNYQRALQQELGPESFIKETIRLNPLDKFAIRRKALESYTFSDGFPSVSKGGIVCVSAYDLMHNLNYYPRPDDFDGSRFVPKATEQQSKFTEVSDKFPVWGYGSLACPGRFYASLIMKLIISQILLTYNVSLENEKARTKWYWESFTMPYESTRIVLRERCRS